MEYKDTLNLPRTKFAMKANLPNREPDFLKRWEDMDLYHRLREQSADREKYILHDGPPYANGHIHMGTALNKVIKDFIVRSRQMSGFNADYVPGWDCHGLPIEHQVDKELGKKKREMDQVQVRKACRKYAEGFIDIQREEFKRLGGVGNWDDPYVTMKYEYEAATARELYRFYKKGSVYRSKKPIYWCNSCQTALAEAEVEYADHTSPSIYVAFPITDDISGKYPELKGIETSFVIWTTTPWTIPANLAVALHPELEYVAVRHGGKAYILAGRLAAVCMDIFGLDGWEKICDIDPLDMEGVKARHPLYDRPSIGVLADYVTLEAGTGLVHTAPGHGREDYETGLRYGLEAYSPLNDRGEFIDEVEFFAGQNVFAANENVIAKLKEVGALLAREEITHSYPHCWRCKKPVIFRATPQWFVSMEENDLRRNALDAIMNKVSWVPSWGRERIFGMIENRPDWCISRQRSWGVPIIIFTCQACDKHTLTDAQAEKVLKAFEKDGADAWFAQSVDELLGEDAVCPHCGKKELAKEKDILDVWFDSGTSFAAVLEQRPELWHHDGEMGWQADMYLEGSDQHRGWFHSSLLCSVGNRNGEPPYKSVLTHGFVVDGKGRKMSKSVGNIIPPEKIIKQYGAEILRMWVAAEDYTVDIRISDNILKQLGEAYFRIRNTMRFMLANISDFDPKTNRVEPAEMDEMERLMLLKGEKLIRQITKAYEEFQFHVVYRALHNFCAGELSGFYLDVRKDRLYTAAPDNKARRATQTVLFDLLSAMVRLMAPIMSFTAEDVWDFFPHGKEKAESVHMLQFPDSGEWAEKCRGAGDLADKWAKLSEARDWINVGMDKVRKEKLLGNSLDAALTIQKSGGFTGFLEQNAELLQEICMVSEIAFTDGPVEATNPEPEEAREYFFNYNIAKTENEKCPRCWKRMPEVGKDGNEVCHGCAAALKEAGLA